MPVYNEEGTYNIAVQSATLTRASTGTPQVVLTLTLASLVGPNNTAQPVRPTRYPPRVYISVTEKTMGTKDAPGWAALTLEHMGFRPHAEDLRSLEGWTGQAYCSYQDDKNNPGEKRENWSIATPNQPQPAQAADQKDIRMLNVLFSEVFKKPLFRTSTQQPAPTPQQPPQQPALPLEDDIPF